ncbi:MAG: TerB family tellurite resistance protein [Gammaproteobacteria bacterium]|nr:TerB family tellurite resistance protein [Gammaproteobacteria bacterium]
MLKRLADLFNAFAATQSAADLDREIQIATAVLMLEVARADSSIDAPELAAISAVLQEDFDLDGDEAKILLAQAQDTTESAVSSYPFTRRLINNLSVDQRALVIERLWRVALSDRRLDKFEEGTIRKLADLLYVPHTAFIRAKHDATLAIDGRD